MGSKLQLQILANLKNRTKWRIFKILTDICTYSQVFWFRNRVWRIQWQPFSRIEWQNIAQSNKFSGTIHNKKYVFKCILELFFIRVKGKRQKWLNLLVSAIHYRLTRVTSRQFFWVFTELQIWQFFERVNWPYFLRLYFSPVSVFSFDRSTAAQLLCRGRIKRRPHVWSRKERPRKKGPGHCETLWIFVALQHSAKWHST